MVTVAIDQALIMRTAGYKLDSDHEDSGYKSGSQDHEDCWL